MCKEKGGVAAFFLQCFVLIQKQNGNKLWEQKKPI